VGRSGLGIAFALMALAPTAEVEFAAIVLSGISFYMFHNTLQTNGTKMAPEARAPGMALFALCLFIGQAIGVPIAPPSSTAGGAPPVFWAAAVVLPALAFWFAAHCRSGISSGACEKPGGPFISPGITPFRRDHATTPNWPHGPARFKAVPRDDDAAAVRERGTKPCDHGRPRRPAESISSMPPTSIPWPRSQYRGADRTDRSVTGSRASGNQFIVATKCVGQMGPEAMGLGMSRKHILDAIEAFAAAPRHGLRRSLPAATATTSTRPIDEALEELRHGRALGKRATRCLNWPAYKVARAWAAAK